MSKILVVNRNPYDEKKNLFSREEVTFEPGLTVLVGCNGSGKTTLLHEIKRKLPKDAAVLSYDNIRDGGTTGIDAMMHFGKLEDGITAMVSSEGERIQQFVAQFVSKIGSIVRSERPKELWVLMDAVGSGLSIDGVDALKDFISFVQKEEKDIEFYFIISTNEYEFAAGQDCIDVTTFNHIRFVNYPTYKSFILRTRKKKDKRYGIKKGAA